MNADAPKAVWPLGRFQTRPRGGRTRLEPMYPCPAVAGRDKVSPQSAQSPRRKERERTYGRRYCEILPGSAAGVHERVASAFPASARRPQAYRLATARSVGRPLGAEAPCPSSLAEPPVRRLTHPRWEPDASVGPVRFCAGGAQ